MIESRIRDQARFRQSSLDVTIAVLLLLQSVRE
jgi:hypothetical protein